MKILSVLSQKGGAGKTTLTLSIAVSAEKDNKQTLVCDLDPQSSAFKWAQRRKTDAPYVVSLQAGALENTISQAKTHGADFTVIDTPAKAENAALKACRISDVILIPCRPSVHDFDAIEASVDIARLSQTSAYVILNAMIPNAFRAFEDLQNAITKKYDVPVLDFFISRREVFAHSALVGQTPQEFEPASKASEEEARLYQWVARILQS